MREALTAIAEELRRLRGQGVRQVAVSDSSLAALRAAVAARRAPQWGVSDANESAKPTVRDEAPPAIAEWKPPAPGAAAPASPRAARPKPADENKLPLPPKVELPAGSKQERWEALRQQVLNDPVCQSHVRAEKKVVFGVGSLEAKIFFCGEAPGAEEEIEGEPFVGPAGEKLTQIIQAMGVKRSDVYIGNIMNWRPQIGDPASAFQVGNRPPTEEELAYCLPYLHAQIEIVQPTVIVGLGGTAAQGLLGKAAVRSVGDVRGRWQTFKGLPLMVTYHPSYLLRQVGAAAEKRTKRTIWEDMLQVMERAGLPVSDKQRNFFT